MLLLWPIFDPVLLNKPPDDTFHSNFLLFSFLTFTLRIFLVYDAACFTTRIYSSHSVKTGCFILFCAVLNSSQRSSCYINTFTRDLSLALLTTFAVSRRIIICIVHGIYSRCLDYFKALDADLYKIQDLML